jgi:hypothetical protein
VSRYNSLLADKTIDKGDAMPLSTEQKQKGIRKFLEKNPDAQARVDGILQAVADALQTPLDTLKDAEAHRTLASAAKALGVDAYELLLMFAADSEEEFRQLQEENRHNLQKALDWCDVQIK